MKKLFKNKKKNTKRKGFTLIELLAVIVILAIVLVVTIPSVISSMNTAKEKQLQNAVDIVADWFNKQAAAAKLGDEFVSEEYNDFISSANTNFTCLQEDASNNCIKKEYDLNNDTAKALLDAAGISNPDDLNLNTSKITIDSAGNAGVYFEASENGKYNTNGEYINYAINENAKLPYEFDLSTEERTGNNDGISGGISIDRYYYGVSANGYYEKDYRIYSPTIGKDSITIQVKASNGAAGYGVMVPFDLSYGTYEISANVTSTQSSPDIRESYYNNQGIYTGWENNPIATAKNGKIIGTFNSNPDGITALVFYVPEGTGTFSDITIKKIRALSNS